MKYWIISDTHMQHENILNWCGRKAGYEQVILDSISKHVAPDDVLIHLGDVAWLQPKKWHTLLREACKGKMWLVLGNHDRNSISWHLSRGWDFVGHSMAFQRHGKKILFTHKPIADNGYDLNVFGHLHLTGHRDEEYQAIKNEKHLLIEIESHMGVRDLDKVLKHKIREMES